VSRPRWASLSLQSLSGQCLRSFFALLERLWHKNQAILRSLVRNILVDPSSVDDVLQDAFIKILESNKHFSNKNEAYNYMRKVVLNTSIDHYRCRRRRNAYSLNPGNPASLSSSAPNPLNLLIEKERDEVENSILKEVRQTLGELSPEQKDAIDIAFNRNHRKIQDICTERELPYSTIRRAVSSLILVRFRKVPFVLPRSRTCRSVPFMDSCACWPEMVAKGRHRSLSWFLPTL